VSKKVRAPVKQGLYDSDEDAKFAAELDQALNSTPKRKTRGAGTEKQKRPKRPKKEGDDSLPKKKRAVNPNSAFHAPMFLSPQLADVVFETELPRPVSPWGVGLM
jgi:chromatin remodeling complex protein RSC6